MRDRFHISGSQGPPAKVKRPTSQEKQLPRKLPSQKKHVEPQRRVWLSPKDPNQVCFFRRGRRRRIPARRSSWSPRVDPFVSRGGMKRASDVAVVVKTVLGSHFGWLVNSPPILEPTSNRFKPPKGRIGPSCEAPKGRECQLFGHAGIDWPQCDPSSGGF